MTSGSGEFGLSRVFYYFVEKGNNFHNFGEARTYIRLALLPFPSSIFTFKPRDFAMDMAEAWLGIKTTIATMHPTLYGDAYANLGRYGFVLGGFYAMLSAFVDKIITRANFSSRILYSSIFGTMFVLLARGAVYNSVANAFWSFLVLYFIKTTFCFIKKKRINISSILAKNDEKNSK